MSYYIDWVQTNLTNINMHDDTGLYAFSRAGQVIYIGIAHRQDVAVEVAQTIRRLGLSTIGLSIWLGYVDRAESGIGRLTEEMILDIECLLIYRNQPYYNTQCKANYTRRRPILVVNRGGIPLNRISRYD